ncbi:MAG: holo-ACP synthase [Nitrospirae bacterium]|nr:holo-ACP synthase [Nitrospirota bacterium]
MILGIGTDIVEIKRIKHAIARWGNRLVERIFSPREIEYCYSKSEPSTHFAARFAAKEALIKAIGTSSIGSGAAYSLKNIEVSNSQSGAPMLVLKPGIIDQDKYEGSLRLHLTLTHEREYACAFVVLETNR